MYLLNSFRYLEMKTKFKILISSLFASCTILFTACSDQRPPERINTGADQNTDEFDPDNIVFYDIGKSPKSAEYDQANQKPPEEKSPYVECDSDSDCLIKNKHVFNPLDPKHTGLKDHEKIPLETKEQAKHVDDEIYNLIDELGSVQESLSDHRNKATITTSVIEKKVMQIEEAELKDEIEKEMQTIEARKIMNSN